MLAAILLAASLVAQAAVPVELLVQSPAETKAELQVICLFHADEGTKLQGSLREIDEKLGGLLTEIHKQSLFAGNLGETLLITPKPHTIPARKLLLVGLGDIKSFSPDREQEVGFIVFEEAKRLTVAHPFFAPTVLDGGKTGTDSGAVAEQFLRGFLRGKASEAVIEAEGMSIGRNPVSLTFLAGAAHAAAARAGLARAERSTGLH
jgi:hypothetical protein